jgi:hypothetical protein
MTGHNKYPFLLRIRTPDHDRVTVAVQYTRLIAIVSKTRSLGVMLVVSWTFCYTVIYLWCLDW